jgi:hypothetical protein
MKSINSKFYLLLLFAFAIMVSCSDDDDPMEMEMEDEDEETITQIDLTFTPQGDGETVTARWFDADGDGTGAPVIEDISLAEGVTYDLSFAITNTLPSTPEDIAAEILEEADEHQLFFAFTDGIFADPTGDGNTDNRNDPINYNDMDSNGLPLGLSTTWTAGGHTDNPGTFNVILKHQPDEKTATSDVNTGGTDFDISFSLNIEEDDEEEEEVINEVVLTFTPQGEGDVVTASFFDADGDGVGAPMIDSITLSEGVTYDLAVTLTNTLGAEPEDVTEEIMEEDDEHQFFFSFTDGIFSDPSGDGNVDNGADPINYSDMDENGLPVGLSTVWTAGGHTDTPGEFNLVLKHQPGQKSATSDVNVGGTDLDITLPLIIAEGNEEEEVINEIILSFVPVMGGDTISARFFDADGEGVGAPTIDDINLSVSTEYNMSITLTNSLGAEPEDVTAEIMEEDDEHMFFFEFTNNAFGSPEGDGNVDERGDPINYNDMDENGLPVGLSTNWMTQDMSIAGGSFRIVLKHQPDQKTATSDVSVGGTDVDITIPLNITL